MPHQSTFTNEMQDCIHHCQNCHAICVETAQHCLGLGGRHSAQDHIALLLACAEACQCSANVMLLGSVFHTRTCAVCAEFCRACAEECRNIAGGDQTMIRCAEMCERCAESCEQMSHGSVSTAAASR